MLDIVHISYGQRDVGLGQSLSQNIQNIGGVATNLVGSQNDVQDTPQIFQDMTESIQNVLMDKDPESMDDVSGMIINVLTERCEKEDSDCSMATRTLIRLNGIFSQLNGLSNLIGEGSLTKLILLFVKMNYGDSLQISAVDLETILKLINNYSGDILPLLNALKDLQHYLLGVNTNITTMKDIAPEVTMNNMLLVGSLAIAIEVVEYWFLKADKHEIDETDDPSVRHVRGTEQKRSILTYINGVDHKGSDVSRVIQNAIFGYLSSNGDAKVAAAFSTLSFANIYGNFGVE